MPAKLATPSTVRSKATSRARGWFTCDRRDIPHLPGCYAIFNNGELVYIGSAVNLRRRIRAQGIIQRWPPAPTRFGPLHALKIKVRVNRRRFEHLTRELRLRSEEHTPELQSRGV